MSKYSKETSKQDWNQALVCSKVEEGYCPHSGGGLLSSQDKVVCKFSYSTITKSKSSANLL